MERGNLAGLYAWPLLPKSLFNYWSVFICPLFDDIIKLMLKPNTNAYISCITCFCCERIPYKRVENVER